MNFCPFCGQKLPGDSAFCPYCGGSLAGAAQTPPAQTAPVQTAPAPKKRRVWAWVLAVVLVLALAAGIGFSSASGERPASAFSGGILPGPESAADISALADSVLYLECFDPEGELVCTGSGFLINDGTILVTNYHVIRDASHVEVWTADFETSTSADVLLVSDRTADLALLQCKDDLGLSPLTLADSETVQQGDKIYAVGYPLGIANTLSDGLVSSFYLDEGDVETIQITAPISEGSSGGALLNEAGQVVGVTTAGYIEGENMNLAIASSHIWKQLERNSKSKPLMDHYMAIEHPAYFTFVDNFDENSYTPVTAAALFASPAQYDGMLVVVEGYVKTFQAGREDFDYKSSKAENSYEMPCLDPSLNVNTIKPSLFYPSVLYGKFSADPNPSAPSPYLESSLIDGCFYIHALDCYIAP